MTGSAAVTVPVWHSGLLSLKRLLIFVWLPAYADIASFKYFIQELVSWFLLAMRSESKNS